MTILPLAFSLILLFTETPTKTIDIFDSEQSVILTDKSDDEIIEMTLEEWELFCDIMSYILDSEFRTYGKNLDVNKYVLSNTNDLIQLNEEDALYYTNWLLKRGKDKNYLKQVLQEIAGCPPPTYESNGELWVAIGWPESDTSPTSVGMNYDKAFWNMACAKPKTDPTEVGRVKGRRYWNKYKKEIINPLGTSDTGGLFTDTDGRNITKYAIDRCLGNNFVRKLAIAYRADFNFVDEKDGMTVLDFLQQRIYMAKRLTPLPEESLKEFDAIYRDIVRAGGKHSEEGLKIAEKSNY